MTPLTMLAAARHQNLARLDLKPCTRTVLVARRPDVDDEDPRAGALHAYVGPLTPSGQRVPRAGRAVCKARTRTLGVVPLSMVGRRRVCLRCTARLAHAPVVGEAGLMSRDAAVAAYDGVTAFDLAVDAWRAETPADVERVEWLALLLVGYPACSRVPVTSPGGKTTGPLDEHIARARRRLGVVRDPLGVLRAAAVENEHEAREAARLRRRGGWQDREDRIARLGFELASRTA